MCQNYIPTRSVLSRPYFCLYDDNYKRCYLITFLLLLRVGRKPLQCKLFMRIGFVFCFLLIIKKMTQRRGCLAAWQRGSRMANSSKIKCLAAWQRGSRMANSSKLKCLSAWQRGSHMAIKSCEYIECRMAKYTGDS